MKTPRPDRKLFFRRILVALVLALSVAAPSTALRAAAGHSCGWQTGCREFPMVCVDKESGKEVPCPPMEICLDAETGKEVSCPADKGDPGEQVNGGWQTGFGIV
jgi:hypothetical protein